MYVLACYEPTESTVTKRTVERLAAGFDFDLDVLTMTRDSIPWDEIAGGEVKRMLGTSDLAQAIDAACKRQDYDLVVVGMRERPGLLRLLLGSRVGRLVHRAPATIWIVRGGPRPVRRIVLGVAGGPQTLHDAELAAVVATVFGATVDLVHILSQLPLLFIAPDELAAAVTEDALAKVDPGLRAVRQAYGVLRNHGVAGRIVLRNGVVLEELLATCVGNAQQAPADLLIIGAHHVGPANAPDYLEDLAEQITQAAPLSTLVVHADGGWDRWRAAMRSTALEL